MLFFAVPKFGRVTQGSLKSATRKMYGLIATAHDKAALQKRRYWLGMELGRGEWWVVVTEPAEGVSPEMIAQRKERPEMEGELPGGVIFTEAVLESQRLKEGTALAVFEPNGTCTEAQINLEDEAGNLAALVVNPLTGRCTISESGPPPEGAAGEGELPAGEAPAAGEEAHEQL